MTPFDLSTTLQCSIMIALALFEKATSLDYSKSNGMIAVKEMRGPGFFPGCIGTIQSGIDLQHFPIMVLGQDFDTATNHKRIELEKGEVDTNTTWRNLKKLLQEVSIDPTKCFFTNAYMGLRPDIETSKTKNTGTSPAAKKGAEPFAQACYDFFKIQLATIQPNLVLVLGKETSKFLSKGFPGSFPKWDRIETLKQFYEKDDQLFADYLFEGKMIRFVFVIHPSLNNTNRSILWGKESGKQKEQELIRKCIEN